MEEIERLRDDVFIDRLLLLTLAGVLWGFSLVFWLFPAPPVVVFGAASLILAGVAVWALPQMAAAKRKIGHLRLGLAGEQAVAEYLEIVAHDGFWVVHDLRGEGFNVDHVIVGTQGVFTIETKTFSKLAGSAARVHYDGATIRVDGQVLDRDPVIQARAQASWLKRTLVELTGQSYPVRPVVVFPGWFVERADGGAHSDVWVLEPKELRGWLSREPHMLPRHAVDLIRSRLKLVARGGA